MSAEQQTERAAFASANRFTPSPYPPGLVAVLTREVGTYKDFTMSYRRLLVPEHTGETILSGGEKVASRNAAVDDLLATPPNYDWLYQLDDDHKFPPDVLLRQLKLFYAEDFDVLGILYLTRLAPTSTYPVGGIFKRDEKLQIQLRNLDFADLPGFGPVLERRDLALGTAGLLIRRRVFAALTRPYFQVGQIRPEKEFEDLYFTIRCQEAGLKVGMDVSQSLGHMVRMALWAERDRKGAWHVLGDMDVRYSAADRMGGQPSPIVRPGLSFSAVTGGRR